MSLLQYTVTSVFSAQNVCLATARRRVPLLFLLSQIKLFLGFPIILLLKLDTFVGVTLRSLSKDLYGWIYELAETAKVR